MITRWGSLCLLLATAGLVHGEVKMPEIFSDGMVLQRDCKIPVWGSAAAGEKVTVTIKGMSAEAVAGADGKWKVELPALQAGGPLTMEIKGNNSIRISDVLVGEVWLCSGQSNMEWVVKNVVNGDSEVAAANYPNIRLFNVPRVWKSQPQSSLNAKWASCTPQSAGNFSAVGYFFGRELNRKLNVPVGLINSSWGGTRIEPWTTVAGFESVPVLREIVDIINLKDPSFSGHKVLLKNAIAQQRQWADNASQCLNNSSFPSEPPAYPHQLLPFQNNQEPTVLYNAMIHPLVPYAMRGAIWYQGESNLGDGSVYNAKMQALINGWRKVFNNPELALYFAQLAPYNYGEHAKYILPLMWETQADFTRNTPNTGMAIINDIGNIGDIHPRNKQDVGYRLALLALARTYGQKGIICDSPSFKAMEVKGGKVVISFANARELKTRDGKAPNWFELAGMDGLYYPAVAVIKGTTVELTSSRVAEPMVMRFAWDMLAEPNLTNEAGLPAGAFRAGEIPERGILDKTVPEAKAFKVIYGVNPIAPVMINNNRSIAYRTDKSNDAVGKIRRIGYFLFFARPDGSGSYVFATMDPFTQSLKKIGVPTKDSGARFQVKVKNLTVKSNVVGVVNGSFPEGNIEFWDCNYGELNAAKIPGGSDKTFDFGDSMAPDASPGYGSMQIHNFAKQQTVMAFNNWSAGRKCDLGIGNNPNGNPDWTFSGSGGGYVAGQLLVLVELE